MCVYCFCGDHAFRWDPPWPKPHPRTPHPAPWHEQIPQPNVPPRAPWSLDRLKEYRDLLKEIRDLEEKIGCECEPNKADYLSLFEERIKQLSRIEK